MMTIEQAAMQLAHCLLDDPGFTLSGFVRKEYADKVAEAMTTVTGSYWTVHGEGENYCLRTIANVDVRSFLEAKMKGE